MRIDSFKPMTVTTESASSFSAMAVRMGASPFLLPESLIAVGGSSHQPLFLCAKQGEEILAIVSGLVIVSQDMAAASDVRSLYCFSGPATIGADAALVGSVIDAIIRHASRAGIERVVLLPRDFPVTLPDGALDYPEEWIEYLIDLRSIGDDGLALFSADFKRKMRKAAARGLKFAFCTDNERSMERLGSLLESTRARRVAAGSDDYDALNLPHVDVHGLGRLLHTGAGRIAMVHGPDGEPLAGAYVLVHGRRAYGLLIGASSEGYQLSATNLLVANLYAALRASGVEMLNIGGVPNDPRSQSLSAFKLSIGGVPMKCHGGTTRHLGGIKRHIARLTGQFIRLASLGFNANGRKHHGN